MDNAQALRIVLELAEQNKLTEREARSDPTVLGPEVNKQDEAIETVREFIKYHYGFTE